MFERFSQEARAVVLRGVRAAEEVGATRVDSAHLLAALAADPGPAGRALAAVGVTRDRVLGDLPGAVDPAALRAVGIDWEEVRRAVDTSFGSGALDRALRRRRRRHLPFTPDAKKLLERTLRVALAARDRRLVPAHMLLAVLGDPQAAGARLLQRYGVEQEALRAALGDPGEDRRAG